MIDQKIDSNAQSCSLNTFQKYFNLWIIFLSEFNFLHFIICTLRFKFRSLLVQLSLLIHQSTKEIPS